MSRTFYKSQAPRNGQSGGVFESRDRHSSRLSCPEGRGLPWHMGGSCCELPPQPCSSRLTVGLCFLCLGQTSGAAVCAEGLSIFHLFLHKDSTHPSTVNLPVLASWLTLISSYRYIYTREVSAQQVSIVLEDCCMCYDAMLI